MPTYCEAEADRRYASRYGDDYDAPDDWDLYGCDNCMCEDCYPDGDCESCDCDECRPDARNVWPVSIESYGYKPTPVFWTTGGFSRTRLDGAAGTREVFLGCEVELEVGGSADSYELRRAWNRHEDLTERVYCKDDSSLDHGVEIVSHPMTLAAWQEVGGGLYGDLGKAGCRAEETCGMHVHINRSSFGSDSHQSRFGLLVLLNADEMAEFAGRWNDSYATFTRNRWSVVRTVRGTDYGNCPRGAVNYLNRATIEVRMFASTTDPGTFLGNLEMVHAMHAYTADKAGATLPEHLTWSGLVRFLEANRATYPNAARKAAAV